MNRTPSQNHVVWLAVVVSLAAIVIMDRAGMAQKWHAAVVGTGLPFIGVTIAYRRKWPFLQFWIALALCFLGHILLMWILFSKVLVEVKTIGILIWSPIAFLEIIALVALMPMIERKLRHHSGVADR